MEAVPKLPLISFELKVSTENTHFGPKLKQYIAEAYREDPDSYSNEIHQLEGLRSAAVRPTVDETGLRAMYRYFCQLRAMQTRFPMAKGQPVACSFSWKDLHANMTCSLADIRFEMACILYNIGALHAQLGASEPRNSAESLKSACTHYQQAAWAFQHLREQYPQPSGVDVSADLMKLLQEICFAQAQECILEKSILDTRKPSVIGAVATQVQYYYKSCLALLGPSAGSDGLIHEIIGTKMYNYWHRYLSFKYSYVGSIVCLYQGMNAEEQQKMGERVAFYQLAVEKLNDARKLAKYIEPTQVTTEALTFTNDVVEGKRKAAKNENEFIYHEEVPDKSLLVDMKPVSLVKAIPIDFSNPENSGPDVFSRLVPMGAHEASSLYSEEKAKLLRQIGSQCETKTEELVEFMSSLQLDQLDVLDEEHKIPQEIVDRCAAMNAKSDVIQTLVDSMNSLAEIISDVEHALDEIKTLIQEDAQAEKEYQKSVGPRPASLLHTELARELHKYSDAHARTTDSNLVLHKACSLHVANLRLLAQPLEALAENIPSVANIEGLDRETMQEMRRVVSKAREMRAQRAALLQQLRDDVAADDVTAKLLASDRPHQEIFALEIDKHLPKVKVIEQNLSAQENIINRLTSLYAAYGESRRLLADVLRKRDALVNALITSYDTHAELLAKCQKGLEFYRKLWGGVSTLRARVRSVVQVQREERDQLHAATRAKASTPIPASVSKSSDSPTLATTAAVPEPYTPKLKDYLPYMKNSNLARSVTPQAPVDPLPTESYYPEAMYPPSVRPAPVGSEASDAPQQPLVDGAGPYARYGSPFATNEIEPYPVQHNYAYPPAKGFEKEEIPNYGYTAYTPQQYNSQAQNAQTYSPYYASTQDNTTSVTDTQQMPYNSISQANLNQYNYDPYNQNNMAQVPGPSQNSYNAGNQSYSHSYMPTSEPGANQPYNTANPAYGGVNQPQIGVGQAYEPVNQSYAVNQPASTSNQPAPPVNAPYGAPNQPPGVNNQAYQPHSSTNPPYGVATSTYGTASQSYNVATQPYGTPVDLAANFAQMQVSVPKSEPAIETSASYQQFYQQQYTQVSGSNTTLVPSQPVDYTNNYNASSASHFIPPTNPNTSNAYGGVEYATTSFDAMSQGYAIYTNAESTPTYSTTSVTTPVVNPQYTYPTDTSTTGLSQLDALDQPIKSHVTGEALNAYGTYQNYDQNTAFQNQNQPTDQNFQQPFGYQNQNIYSQYQNHPGYGYNPGTGSYDYNYGSQNAYSTYNSQGAVEVQNEQNLSAHNLYTSAGQCQTVQSPSETPQVPQTSQGNPHYYHSPYGYQTMQPNEMVPDSQAASTNYGANMNQSTYMQSNQMKNTNVTFSNQQVSATKEDVESPKVEQSPNQTYEPKIDQNYYQPTPEIQETVKTEPVELPPEEPTEDPAPEVSAFDLLSDIDFTVEYKPLMPEIKVPQISESVIVKPTFISKPEVEKPPEPKEEVIEQPPKRDIFSDPVLLNTFTQEVKNLQKLVDSLTDKSPSGLTVLDAKWKSLEESQCAASKLTSEASAYNDYALKITNEPDAFINASYYKNLSPWCIPLAISSCPSENKRSKFWKAVADNKIDCVVCLLSEIEMQGNSYWPTAKGQTLQLSGVAVTLDDVTCTVHWTERRLTVARGNNQHNVVHFQVNVFPAKVVCSPLVMLSQRVLEATCWSRRRGALLQCATGAGRCSVLALLLAVQCAVRAGQIHLCELLEVACVELYKCRAHVLEDTKYLADAYRTVLFYVQGVLCSGTTQFNGETVSISGAAAPPPAAPAAPGSGPAAARHKYSRESFEEMKTSGLKNNDMKDPLNFLDPLWSLKKK